LQDHLARNEITAAFLLARDARDDLADDPEFAEIWTNVVRNATIRTDPPGAKVSVRPFGDFAAAWIEIGRSPLEGVPVPQTLIRPLQARLELEGFGTREVAVLARQMRAGVEFKLDPLGHARDDALRVPPDDVEQLTVSRRPSFGILETVTLPAFEIDRFEVTNRQFAEFVERGGYQDRKLWKIPFTEKGREIPLEQAIARFVDATGRPGPATWRFGTYPEGQQDHPVGGVSWYEAAAYAEFAGKKLPTLFHWDAASGARFAGYIVGSSNFGNGPLPVGSTLARSPADLSDTAGNVREWCWNVVGEERLAMGAAWNDAPYLFDRLVSRSAFDRDSGNGFRCARYDPAAIPAELLGPVERSFRDYSQERPVSDQEFQIFRRFYAYEQAALNAASEEIRDERYWTIEKVSYDSAYGERIPAYLYVPKNAAPPYRPIVYFPGSTAEVIAASQDRLELLVPPLVRSGRAVLYPIYKGTYERAIRGENPVFLTLDGPAPTRPQPRQDNVIMAIRDVFRSVDYLRSRDDMQLDAISYVGWSLGARLGAISLGLEQRFRAAVLLDGGLHLTPKDQRLPESDEINFLPRIKTPTLMVSGRFDGIFPVEEAQQYFFQWLGTATKRHSIYDRGHGGGLTDEMIREILGWLDEHAGIPAQTPRRSESPNP
jgi:dienelactone hydrolase